MQATENTSESYYTHISIRALREVIEFPVTATNYQSIVFYYKQGQNNMLLPQ